MIDPPPNRARGELRFAKMRLGLLLLAAFGLGGMACADDHHDTGSVNCATETRDDEFVVGLTKIGNAGAVDYRLMSADPAPPQRGDNVWVVQLHALANGVLGDPVAGATIVVTPFMPDHQHGTPIPVTVEAAADPGQYTLSPVNLWMPGLWEVTLDVTASTGSDQAIYRFCIPS